MVSQWSAPLALKVLSKHLPGALAGYRCAYAAHFPTCIGRHLCVLLAQPAIRWPPKGQQRACRGENAENQ